MRCWCVAALLVLAACVGNGPEAEDVDVQWPELAMPVDGMADGLSSAPESFLDGPVKVYEQTLNLKHAFL